MNECIIRAAVQSDFSSIFALLKQLSSNDFDSEVLEKIFSDHLEDPAITYFIAEYEGRTAGFISVHMQTLLHHAARVAEIQELCVDEEFRSKKIGSLLLERASGWAQSKRCVLLEVACSMKREGAHRFYEREQFTRSHYTFTRPLPEN